MNQKIRVSLPEPCHENWSKMTPNEKGRFCSVCQKNVFDFTKLSDLEIINTFNENSDLCGRIKNSQLNRTLTKQKKSFLINGIASLIALLGLGNHSTKAQTGILSIDSNIKGIFENTPNYNEIYLDSLSKLEKILSYPITILQDTEIKERRKSNPDQISSGLVFYGNYFPLPEVLIINTRTKESVISDYRGYFNIPAEKTDVLICIDHNFKIDENARVGLIF